MGNKLRFELKLKAHPYSQDSGADFENWGCISINMWQDEKPTTLLDWEWDLNLLAAWFFENEVALRHHALFLAGNSPLPSESLAQALNRFRERDFGNDEKAMFSWDEEIFKYYEKHGLTFALRGAAVPDIIIGLNRNVGEISLSSDKKEWAYQFDMNDFCEDLAEKLKRLTLKSGQVV